MPDPIEIATDRILIVLERIADNIDKAAGAVSSPPPTTPIDPTLSAAAPSSTVSKTSEKDSSTVFSGILGKLESLINTITETQRWQLQQSKPFEDVHSYATQAALAGGALSRDEIKSMARRQQQLGKSAAEASSTVHEEAGMLPNFLYQLRDKAVDTALSTARRSKSYIDANISIHNSTNTKGR